MIDGVIATLDNDRRHRDDLGVSTLTLFVTHVERLHYMRYRQRMLETPQSFHHDWSRSHLIKLNEPACMPVNGNSFRSRATYVGPLDLDVPASWGRQIQGQHLDIMASSHVPLLFHFQIDPSDRCLREVYAFHTFTLYGLQYLLTRQIIQQDADARL